MRIGKATILSVAIAWLLNFLLVQLDLTLGRPVYHFFIPAFALAGPVLYFSFGSHEDRRDQRFSVLILLASSAFIFTIFSTGYLAASKQGMVTTCRANMRTVGDALLGFKEENGRYPDSLDKLAPSFVPKMPTCPVEGLQAYTDGYQTGPDETVLMCKGSNHAQWTEPDFPKLVIDADKYEIVDRP